MLKLVLIVLVLGVVAVLGYAATKPNAFRYERKATIKAPPEKIFAILNDPRKGVLWSPFEQADPAMKKTFSGAETGTGSVYEWDGDKNAGAGRMEIVESVPPSKIVSRLEFFRPFKATNTAEFIMTPRGDSTEVTWAMYGPVPFIGKIMNVFINCENMVGGQFEKGLANLKALAEQ